MVTVFQGRNSCSTFRAASRATVPSASSSPEQATIPAFLCGRSGMDVSFGDLINLRGNLLGQGTSKLLAFDIQLGDTFGLQSLVAAKHFEHGDFARDLASAVLHQLGGAHLLAAVDGHRKP